VDTPYGAIDMKIARVNGQINKATPEYEQCREAARRAQLPLRVIEEAARLAFYSQQNTAPNSDTKGD
jgi:uncharacterized protein (DUF111 family)